MIKYFSIYEVKPRMIDVKRYRRAASIALCAGMVGITGSFVPGDSGLVPQASAQTRVLPKDEISISVLADGTHAGPGTSTFLNSANGYNPGDDNATDGVVSSHDTVTYQVNMHIAAGPARTVRVEFVSAGDGLNLADFSGLNMNSHGVKGTWRDGGFDYQIDRGTTVALTGTVTVRAKDTAGVTVDNNVVEAKIINGGTTVANSKAREITVISAPLADLTIDTVNRPNVSYNQSSNGGSFLIAPTTLKVEGYSTNGLVSSSEWITDVDVSEFPAGTTWTFDGNSVTPEGGVIKNLRSTGSKVLSYILPDDAKPTEENPSQVYTVSLRPHEDSFAVGETRNITDAGTGEQWSYDTSTFTWNGENVGALRGYAVPNNNFSRHTWYFYEEPLGEIWRYDVAAPTNNNFTYFEDPNLYWRDGADYHGQGKTYPWRKFATNDNDLYNRLTFHPSRMGDDVTGSTVAVQDNLRVESGSAYQDHDYDQSRRVVVTMGGAVIDPQYYTVEFAVDGQWVESDSPIEGSLQSRVTFAEDLFDATSETVQVYWPTKAHADYDPNTDSGKLLTSQGQFSMDGDASNMESDWTARVPLAFMQPPTVITDIKPVGDPVSNNSSGYDTKWRIEDMARTPHVSSGYSATRTIVLDPLYDASTFNLTKSGGWVVDKIDGQVVTMRRDDIRLDVNNYLDRANMGAVEFTVSTVANPAVDEADALVTGSVAQDITLNWNKVAAFDETSAHSEATASQNVNSRNLLSQSLRALNTKEEIDSQLSWEVVANLGRVTQAGQKWTQDIVLPYNGDIVLMDKVNDINGSTIDIDPETGLDNSGLLDGVGRSKFSGSYDLSAITLSDMPVGTTVTLLDAAGEELKTIPVADDGTVSLDGVNVGGVRTIRINGQDNTSDEQSAGVKVVVSIDTKDNARDDDYVLWAMPVVSASGTVVGADGKREVMAWPQAIDTVDSTVSGTLWEDSDKDGVIDDTEKARFGGVSVELQRKDVNGNWVTVPERLGKKYTSVTEADGTYKFETLKSGEYRVVLPHVVKNQTENMNLEDITSANDTDGDLTLSQVNRFDVTTVTELTRSYNKYRNYAQSQTELHVGKDSATTNVDFGFVTALADIALDKKPAAVTTGQNSDTVTWDIEVKNTSDRVISGATLSDRTSSEVQGLTATIGYAELEKWGITGTNAQVIGDYPMSSNQGYLISTSDGVWVGGGADTLTKLDDITGTNVQMIGENPMYASRGYLISTSDGVWVGGGTDTLTKLDDITGTNVQMLGDYPKNSYDGYLISTSDGVWVGGGTGTPTKVDAITGTNVQMTGDYPMSSSQGYLISTSDGVWVGGGADTLTKLDDITGTNVQMTGERPTGSGYGYLISTSDGIWAGSGTDTPTQLGSDKYKYLADQTLMQQGTERYEAGTDGRSWIRREYALPDLLPGESTTVRLTGTVRTDVLSDKLVVGNQAWITSPETPRAGITVSHPEISVTGTGQDVGVPDIPVLPSVTDVDKLGIHGTKTVALNTKDVNSDSTVVDDLADQTPAVVGKAQVVPDLGSISGVAWYDTERNNNRDDAEARAGGILVTVMNKAGEVLAQTRTNDNGEWSVDKLIAGMEVDVFYDIAGHEHDGKIWTPVVANPDSDSPTDSDTNSSGQVIRPSNTVVAKVGGNSGMADMGLQVVAAGVDISKAQEGDDTFVAHGERALEESINIADPVATKPVSGIDAATGQIADTSISDPRTPQFGWTLTNTGNERLSNVTITDETVQGLAAKLVLWPTSSKHDPGNPEQLSLTENGIVVDSTGKPYVLEPGESISGALRVGFTLDNTEHKNTLSVVGTPVNDTGDPIGNSVHDSDPFTATYNFVKERTVTLRKVDAVGRNTEQELALSGAQFRVEQLEATDITQLTENSEVVVKREIGMFRTGNDGQVGLSLPSGIYRVTETAAPKDYELPEAGHITHYIDLRYVDGQPQVKVKTVTSEDTPDNQKVISVGIDAEPGDTTWGVIEVDNVETIKITSGWLPRSGEVGIGLGIFLVALALGATGIMLHRKNEKDGDVAI